MSKRKFSRGVSAPRSGSALATRADTLVLARATAEILRQADEKPEKFSKTFQRKTYEERKKRFSKKVIQIETGVEPVTQVVARGWKLTEQLDTDSEYFSSYSLLVLETAGSLAVVERISSFIAMSGDSRAYEVGLKNAYPQLGILSTHSRYENPALQEAFVQRNLADLVVPHELHVGTIFEGIYQSIATPLTQQTS